MNQVRHFEEALGRRSSAKLLTKDEAGEHRQTPELLHVRRGTVLPRQATGGDGNSEGSCVKIILQ